MKRAAEICNGIVDIIGYIGTEFTDTESKRYLYTRETPTLFAGSRFKYLAPKIEFSYDNLVTAISEAIQKAESLDGATVIDSQQLNVATSMTLNYNEIRNEAEQLWGKLVGIDEANAERILKKAEMIFGRKIRLSEITEDQVDLYYLLILEMRDML